MEITLADKIRLKPHIEYCWSSGVISFFCRPGESIDINDKSKFVFEFCKKLDGNMKLTEVRASLTHLFPREVNYINDLIEVLDKELLLENVEENKTNTLSEDEVEKWSKNIAFFNSFYTANNNKFHPQEVLKNKKVCILGLGGVGSNVLTNLIALGFQNIKVVDFDFVEPSNSNRQILYDQNQFGKRKATVIEDFVNQGYPDVNIEVSREKISSGNDLYHFIDGSACVISAIDEPRDRILDWVNLTCVNRKIPFVSGGVDSRWVTYFSVLPNKSGCVECWKDSCSGKTKRYQEIVNQDNFVASKATNVAIMPLISILSGLISMDVLKIITGLDIPKSVGALLTFDFVTSSMKVTERWERSDSCRVCGVS